MCFGSYRLPSLPLPPRYLALLMLASLGFPAKQKDNWINRLQNFTFDRDWMEMAPGGPGGEVTAGDGLCAAGPGRRVHRLAILKNTQVVLVTSMEVEVTNAGVPMVITTSDSASEFSLGFCGKKNFWISFIRAS